MKAMSWKTRETIFLLVFMTIFSLALAKYGLTVNAIMKAKFAIKSSGSRGLIISGGLFDNLTFVTQTVGKNYPTSSSVETLNNQVLVFLIANKDDWFEISVRLTGPPNEFIDLFLTIEDMGEPQNIYRATVRTDKDGKTKFRVRYNKFDENRLTIIN